MKNPLCALILFWGNRLKDIDNKWLKMFYITPFRIIGFFYRTYTANRDRISSLEKKPWASTLFRSVMVITMIVWIGIWLMASDESRNRLTEAVKSSLGSFNTQEK